MLGVQTLYMKNVYCFRFARRRRLLSEAITATNIFQLLDSLVITRFNCTISFKNMIQEIRLKWLCSSCRLVLLEEQEPGSRASLIVSFVWHQFVQEVLWLMESMYLAFLFSAFDPRSQLFPKVPFFLVEIYGQHRDLHCPCSCRMLSNLLNATIDINLLMTGMICIYAGKIWIPWAVPPMPDCGRFLNCVTWKKLLSLLGVWVEMW